jgi:hypothetical protein
LRSEQFQNSMKYTDELNLLVIHFIFNTMNRVKEK